MKRNRLKKKAVTKKDLKTAQGTLAGDPVILALTGIRFRTPADKQNAVRVIHSMMDAHGGRVHKEAMNESLYYRTQLDRSLSEAHGQIARLEASIHQIHRDHAQQIINAITRSPTTETMGLSATKEATDGKRNR